MRRRWVLAASVLAALVIAGVLVWQLVSLRGVLSATLTTAFGREVTIDGPSKLVFVPGPGLRIESVRVAAAEGSALGEVRFGRFKLALAPMPLLWGDLRPRVIELDDAEITLVPAAVGEKKPREEARDEATDFSWVLELDQVAIRRVSFTRTSEDGTKTRESLESLTLQRDSERSAVLQAAGKLGRAAFDVSGALQRRDSTTGDGGGPSHDATLKGKIAGFPAVGGATIGRQDGSLALSDIDVQVGERKSLWLSLKGSLDHLDSLSGFDAKVQLEIRDSRALGRLMDDPPDIGEVTLEASLSDRDGTPGLESFSLSGGHAGALELEASGRFGDVRGLDDLDAKVSVSAPDLAAAAELLRRPVPSLGGLGPLRLAGRVTSTQGKLHAEASEIRIGETLVRGTLDFDAFRKPRPLVDARLTSSLIDLRDMGLTAKDAAGAAPADGDSPAGDPPASVFGEDPIPLDWTDRLDAKLRFATERVTGAGGHVLDHLEIEASLSDRKLDARHLAFHFDGGQTQSKLHAETAGASPAWSVEAYSRGISIERLVAQLQDSSAYTGRLDAAVTLRSSGSSPHAIVTALAGDVTVSCGGGTVSPEAAGLLTRDLFRATRRLFGFTEKTEKLNCLLADLGFEAGVGEVRHFLLDIESMRVVGEGKVDLSAESLDLRLVPIPSHASALSTAATVRVQGPLRAPKVHVEAGSLVKSTTYALLKNLGRTTGLHQAWERLIPDKSRKSVCESLIDPTTQEPRWSSEHPSAAAP